ncbi:serine/threonine protein kinase, partial [bacterium]|nr:serine/threonine protein kinase [bacterium]
LQGESLASLLRRQQPIEPLQFVDLFYSIALAVQCMHDQGLVHRDLKPDNIFLRQDGRPTLMDFGIAFSEELTRATKTGLAMGTPAYMAPEQIQGQAVPASDQYSLGVLAFLCLTGQRPFQAEEPMALAMQHLHTPPPLPSSVRTSLPVPFNHVILRMLAKKPGERFASVMDAANALRGALNLSEQEEEATGLVGP